MRFLSRVSQPARSAFFCFVLTLVTVFSTTRAVVAQPPPPTVDFSVDVAEGPSPLAVQFTNLSGLAGVTSWLWDFGDGSFSNERDPLHVYVTGGSFTVELRATAGGEVTAISKSDCVRVDDEIRIDDFEQPDLETLWDVMGKVKRTEEAALFGRWGIRFGDSIDTCIDCGGDPDVICGNMAFPEPSGHLRFWVDYSLLRVVGPGSFKILRLLNKTADGPEVFSIEHKSSLQRLWVRIVGSDSTGPVASSPWVVLGRLDGRLQQVGFEVYWGPNPTPILRGNLAMSLDVYDALTDTWPVSTGTLAYQSDLTSYRYVVLGVSPGQSKVEVDGLLDLDAFAARRYTPVPLF